MLEGLYSITDELALAIERSRAQSALHLTEDRIGVSSKARWKAFAFTMACAFMT